MIQILDCTLRDGGYYNHWDFSSVVVKAYISSMVEAKIDFIELGMRNFSQKGFRGAFAYTTEDFLNRLDLPMGPEYGVMVDAKTILNSDLGVEEAVDHLFVQCEDSKISLVRIAAHFHEVERSGTIVKALKKKGYLVGINLMQSGGKPSELISDKARIAKSWGELDVLYFADSLGNMDNSEVKRIIEALRQYWSGDLGIHTHNNMANALSNCLTAKNAGVKWLDVTVTGMGRGAGNAETEKLLAVMSQDECKYNATPVYDLAIRHFEPMKKIHGWGSNLLYFLGAQNNLHPTYIQNLLSDSHFGTDELVGAIDYLSKQSNSTSYSGDVYKAALSFSGEEKPISGTSHLCGIASNKEVLVLANGPSLQRYLDDVKAYISSRKPMVIALNVILELDSFIDYYCISHNNKFLSEQENYSSLSGSVILPKHRFKETELQLFSEKCNLTDYGLIVQNGCFSVEEKKCVIPFDITTAYAFCIAEVMNADSLSLVGFDGYESNDPRQLEMLKIINMMKTLKVSDTMVALTPTSYPVLQGSIYAPV